MFMLFDIKNITFKVDDKVILAKQNFSLTKKNHLLVIGSSGSGKTTLINLMAGLLKPSSGDISFENKYYSSMSENEIDSLRAHNFGFIFQKLHLIGHLNVEQNISIARNNLNISKIDKFIDNLGLTKLKKQKAKYLSFGEAQRVAIARGLANNPKVIFADEPTSALDDKNTKLVIELLLLESKKINSTLVVCTHDIRIKNFFSNILEVNNE